MDLQQVTSVSALPAKEDVSATPDLWPDYVSPKEFVFVTGLSMSTVRRLIKNMQIPALQPGGPRSRILIPREALASYKSPTGRETFAGPMAQSCCLAEDAPQNRRRYRSGPGPKWRQNNNSTTL